MTWLLILLVAVIGAVIGACLALLVVSVDRAGKSLKREFDRITRDEWTLPPSWRDRQARNERDGR
jgi:hypothetical protein